MSLGSQRFCLRWNNHQSNLLSVFDQLLHDEAFVDVTLAVEGQFLRAHKMVLSACSPYFQTLFVGHPDKHPIVILKDVPYADMRSLLDFMYRGEVSVDQDRLTAFLKVAESLRIKGLTEVNEERCDLPSIASSLLSSAPSAPPPPPPHLHRIHHIPPHKRNLPPMAANPLLGSALTAPKRKRGRPRKLSGSGDQPNGNGQDDQDDNSQPNRTDSPVMHITSDLLEVNMGEMQQSPGVCGSGGGGGSSSGSSSGQSHRGKDSQSQDGIAGNADADTLEDAADDQQTTGNVPTSIKLEPGVASSSVKMEHGHQTNQGPKHEPTPSTSVHSGAADGERYPSVAFSSAEVTCTKINLEDTSALDENSNRQQPFEDMDECYEDMIACSPGSFGSERDDGDGDDEDEEENERKSMMRNVINLSLERSDPSLVIKQEKEYNRNDSDILDEDISQYEMDSFRSMMTGYGTKTSIVNTPTQIIPRISISPSTMSSTTGIIQSIAGDRLSRNRPIDKASVRRYCTHEADNVYRCNVCAKTYTHISNFCRHFLSAHHGVRQEIPCPVCFKLFTRKDNMMTHTKQVHRLAIARGAGGGSLATTPALPDSNISQELLLQQQQHHSNTTVGGTSQLHHLSNDSS